ncbi:MAG: DUF4421 family protein [Chitinophagales bacterium]
MLKKKYKISALLICSLLFVNTIFCQKSKKEFKREKRIEKQIKNDLKANNKVDSNYIELLPKDKILIGIQGGGVDNRYILRDNKNKKYYALSSSIIPSAGVHFKYKRLPTISFSLPLNLIVKNSPFVTKGYNFGLHFQPSRLLFFDMYMFQINGLKLDNINTNDTLQTYHGSNTFNLNMEMFFVFNNAKFSYKNAYLAGEIQKKSAGSVALGISYSFFNQKNEDKLFTSNLDLYKTLNYEKIWGFSLASMLGYMHTFVISKHWYIGAGLFYGPNLHFGKKWYNSSEKDKGYFNVSSTIKAKFATGYNSKKVLVKLIAHGGFYGYKPLKKNAFNNYISDFRLSITYII